jgi:hypothetical protein
MGLLYEILYRAELAGDKNKAESYYQAMLKIRITDTILNGPN